MSENALQISGKATNGLIFVVGGNNYDEFFQNLLAVNNGDVDRTNATLSAATDLVNVGPAGPTVEQAAQNVQNAFPGSQPVQQQSYQQPQQQYSQPQQSFQQPSGPPPGSSAPMCMHGQRVWKEGTGKNNKPWKAWMCPSSDRANQCAPDWVR